MAGVVLFVLRRRSKSSTVIDMHASGTGTREIAKAQAPNSIVVTESSYRVKLYASPVPLRVSSVAGIHIGVSVSRWRGCVS